MKVFVLIASLCCQAGAAEAPSQPVFSFFPRDACWVGVGLLGELSPQKRIPAKLLLKKNLRSFSFRSQLGGGVVVRMGIRWSLWGVPKAYVCGCF